jgi:hypothetical protein
MSLEAETLPAIDGSNATGTALALLRAPGDKERRHGAFRECPRFSVRYRVRLVGECIQVEGELYSLSTSGCAVESAAPMQTGDYLELYIELPDDELPLKIDLAGVRWATRREFGAQFITVSNSDRHKLQRHLGRLHRQAESPAEVLVR